MNVHALADVRAERAQGAQLEDCAFEQPPRDDAQRLLHHPVAHVEAAPDRRAQRTITANQQALAGRGQPDGQRRVDDQSGEEQKWPQQQKGDQAEPLDQPRQSL